MAWLARSTPSKTQILPRAGSITGSILTGSTKTHHLITVGFAIVLRLLATRQGGRVWVLKGLWALLGQVFLDHMWCVCRWVRF